MDMLDGQIATDIRRHRFEFLGRRLGSIGGPDSKFRKSGTKFRCAIVANDPSYLRCCNFVRFAINNLDVYRPGRYGCRLCPKTVNRHSYGDNQSQYR
jgi:hypothetical protein